MGEAGLDQWQDGYPSEEIIRDDIRNGESRVWEEDGTILGTAMLSFRGEPDYDRIYDGEWKLGNVSYATIHRIAVLSTIRRHGIAGKLLEKLCSYGKERGLERYILEVRAGNEPAIHLYERSGFTRVGIRKGFYEQPVEDAVIMVKG